MVQKMAFPGSIEIKSEAAEKKPALAPAILCLLAFCIVSFVIGDGVAPMPFFFIKLLTEDDTPLTMRALLLTPIIGLLVSSFITYTLSRSLVRGISVLGLLAFWIVGLILFVAYPPIPTPDPTSPKIVAAVSSIPFVVVVAVLLTQSIRGVLSEARQLRSVKLTKLS